MLLLTSNVLTCLLFATIVVSTAGVPASTVVSSAAEFPFIVGVIDSLLLFCSWHCFSCWGPYCCVPVPLWRAVVVDYSAIAGVNIFFLASLLLLALPLLLSPLLKLVLRISVTLMRILLDTLMLTGSASSLTFEADPDPDPDPDLTFWFDADPDPQHGIKLCRNLTLEKKCLQFLIFSYGLETHCCELVTLSSETFELMQIKSRCESVSLCRFGSAAQLRKVQ